LVQVFPPPQSLPSLSCVWEQPALELQPSDVQGLLSSQLLWPPAWQLPAKHTSSLVQALPSSQGPEFFSSG
jgi:hypothetical protein